MVEVGPARRRQRATHSLQPSDTDWRTLVSPKYLFFSGGANELALSGPHLHAGPESSKSEPSEIISPVRGDREPERERDRKRETSAQKVDHSMRDHFYPCSSPSIRTAGPEGACFNRVHD